MSEQLNNVVTKYLGVDFLKTQWLNAISAFKQKEAQFRLAYIDLLNNKQKYYNAGLRKEYDFAFSKGRIINNSVESVINASKKIYDYFTAPASNNLNALPFVAAIPIGTIIGITALIGAFLLAYNVLQKGFQEYNIRQLPTDQQAAARAKIVADVSAPLGAGISGSIYAIGGIILLVMLLPKLMNKGK